MIECSINSVRFSDVVCSADNTVIKWDILKGVELMRFEGHTDVVYSLALRQDETVHVGVRCDQTGEMPIVGVRYKKRGGKGINLSEHAFTRCSANEKAKYIKVLDYSNEHRSQSRSGVW